jgi:hypothetical protein
MQRVEQNIPETQAVSIDQRLTVSARVADLVNRTALRIFDNQMTSLM